MKNKYRIFSKDRPTDDFTNVIVDGASPVADCEHCGRVHFDVTGEFMDDGELEDLLKKQKANPKKYIARERQVHSGHLNGKQAVYDCPCNVLRVYEDLFWDNRDTICEYLSVRCESMLAEAKKTHAAATKAKKAVKNARAK
jgi:Zn-finger nucleic acid-binding protein